MRNSSNQKYRIYTNMAVLFALKVKTEKRYGKYFALLHFRLRYRVSFSILTNNLSLLNLIFIFNSQKIIWETSFSFSKFTLLKISPGFSVSFSTRSEQSLAEVWYFLRLFLIIKSLIKSFKNPRKCQSVWRLVRLANSIETLDWHRLTSI